MLIPQVMKSGAMITTQQRELKIIFRKRKNENNFSNRFSIDNKVDVTDSGNQKASGWLVKGFG